MPDQPRYRTLVETDEYKAQLYSFVERYSEEIIDAALAGVLWGVASHPERYDRVTGHMYIAKSRSVKPLHPRFRIYFAIPNENEVLLLWIEELSTVEEIGIELK
jgi:hypothetical protein